MTEKDSGKSPVTLRIAGVADDSIVDGPGIRLAVFTQGCPHRCPDCQNPHTHDFDGGRAAEISELVTMMESNPLLDGLTLTGGEPFAQAGACAVLAARAHKLGLHVIVYTGYTYEQLTAAETAPPDAAALLAETDLLVDGPFEQASRSLELRFRGSKNQRFIDVRRSEELRAAVVLDPDSI
jgi:anaerobic ribonucleoside-triphosphate reductase activating protein